MNPEAPLSILTYSSLFPNREQTRHGIFVAERLRHLRAAFPVSVKVVAPVPWFPFAEPRFGEYGRMARVPPSEQRDGLNVVHPRYLVVPGLSWRFSPLLMYAATVGCARALHARHRFDMIDAHFFYPDGVAAWMIGRALGLPVVITARGNDISLMPGFALPRRFIQRTIAQVDAMITVCGALRDALLELGAEPARVHVMRNGVDLDKFVPVDARALRSRLVPGGQRMLLSVGHLIERKGNHLTIEALAALPDTVLVLVGDGPEEAALRQRANELAVADRVVFAGAVPQDRLPEYYSAADAMVLASSREGWANVLLESMACGTPVVATNVWGTPEAVQDPIAGELVERTAADIARGCRALLARVPASAEVRRYAERFSWDDTSADQYRLFTAVVARHGARATR